MMGETCMECNSPMIFVGEKTNYKMPQPYYYECQNVECGQYKKGFRTKTIPYEE